MLRLIALIVLLIVPGVIVVVLCTQYAQKDWAQLQAAYQHFRALAEANASLRAIIVAEAAQNAHRLNLFAEGTGMLLGALLAGLGIHGLCTMAIEE